MATRIKTKLIQSGLIVLGMTLAHASLARTCPINPEDALEGGGPVADVDPPAQPGTPELDIDDVYQFVLDNNITSLKDMLSAMPDHMKGHYALLEKTRALNTASPTEPGIMMYSVDGTFLLNIGVDPSHELYEVVDMAYLQGEDDGPRNGEWRFASIDFRQSPPALVDDTNTDSQSACFECHGNPADGKPPLPIWGEYLVWNDVIGDVKGQQSEQLEASETVVLKNIASIQATHDRYHAIKMYSDVDFHYSVGRTFSLPGINYGYANTVSSMELGTALVESLHTRMKKNAKYASLREEYILSSICESATGLNSAQEDQFRSVLASNGVSVGANEEPHRKHIFQALGLNYEHEMARDKLANDPTPPTEGELDYSLVNDGIYQVLDGVVLHELVKENAELASILESFNVHTNYTPCNLEGWSGLKTLRYRENQLFTLKGDARQAARENYFQTGNFRYQQGIFGDEGKTQICNFFKQNIGVGTVGDGGGVATPTPTSTPVATPAPTAPPTPPATPLPTPVATAPPIPSPTQTPSPGGSELVNGQDISDLSSAEGEQIFFTLNVPAGAENLNFSISADAGDADIYVRFGARPSRSTYDCRPWTTGSNESCAVNPVQAGVYHVMIDAYNAYSGLTLSANFDSTSPTPTAVPTPVPTATPVATSPPLSPTPPPSTPGDSELSNGQARNNLSAAESVQRFFTLNVPAGAENLRFSISGGTGDADLYVRFGERPTSSTYDCRPWTSGNNENCVMNPVREGVYHVMINAYNSYSGLTLLAAFESANPTPLPPPPPSTSVPDVCAAGGQTGGADSKYMGLGDSNAWCIDGSRRLSDNVPLYRHFLIRLSNLGFDDSIIGKSLRIRTGRGGADRSEYGDLSMYVCSDCGIFPHENHYEEMKNGTWSPGTIYGAETPRSVSEEVIIPINSRSDVRGDHLITIAPPRHRVGDSWPDDEDSNGVNVDHIGVSIVAELIDTGSTSAAESFTFEEIEAAEAVSPIVYCTAKGGGNFEYIDGVKVGRQYNYSGELGSALGRTGFSDFSDEPIKAVHLTSGSEPFTLTPGFVGAAYPQHWGIWIDFNSDGMFSAAEKVSTELSGSGEVSGTMSITSDEVIETKMRVIMKHQSPPESACGSIGRGEVEDYRVLIHP